MMLNNIDIWQYFILKVVCFLKLYTILENMLTLDFVSVYKITLVLCQFLAKLIKSTASSRCIYEFYLWIWKYENIFKRSIWKLLILLKLLCYQKLNLIYKAMIMWADILIQGQNKTLVRASSWGYCFCSYLRYRIYR